MENKSSTAPQLSVSIVLFNSPLAYLRRTLQSLVLSCSKAERDGHLGGMSVHIVDNTVDPEYRLQVESLLENVSFAEFIDVDYSELTVNRGFGAGNNYLISGLKSDFHLVLNPDVELTETAISAALYRLSENDDVVLLSPRVANENGSQEFLCKRFPTVFVLLLRAFAPEGLRRGFQRRLDHYEMRDICSDNSVADIDLASGCFMMMRTSVFQQTGGFNEEYFLYFEDFDLTLRLREFGRTVFDPAVEIVHHGGYAASKGFRHMVMFIRAGIRFFNHHGWRWI